VFGCQPHFTLDKFDRVDNLGSQSKKEKYGNVFFGMAKCGSKILCHTFYGLPHLPKLSYYAIYGWEPNSPFLSVHHGLDNVLVLARNGR